MSREFTLLFDEVCDHPLVRVESKQLKIYPHESIPVVELLPGSIQITREELRKAVAMAYQYCSSIKNLTYELERELFDHKEGE